MLSPLPRSKPRPLTSRRPSVSTSARRSAILQIEAEDLTPLTKFRVPFWNEEMHSEGCEALDPETLLFQRAGTQLLEQAMNHLPDRLREVLVLRELEGLSYREIAEVVGVPMGTVMSTLFRAREQFRRAASDLVRQQAQPKGSSAPSDG